MNSKTPTKQNGKQQLSPMQNFRDILERQSSQFALVMPAETVDRFKRIIVTTLNDKPDLLRCTPRSLINVCMHAAQDGLMLDGREAAIAPYKNRESGELIATYMPMVLGLRKKVRASELIADWNVQAVFDNDQFDIAFGDAPYVRHKPALIGGGKRAMVGAYSVATFKDGTKSIEWMTLEQIEEIRGKSKAKSGPWDDPIFFPEMARKTVARRHAKQLPMTSDIENIFRHEDESQEGSDGPHSPPPPQAVEHGGMTAIGTMLDDFGSGMLNPPSNDVNPSAARTVSLDEAGGAPELEAPTSSPGADLSEPAAAWQRGHEDKLKGSQRKANPGEYRDRRELWQAWLDGYDEIPLTTGAKAP